MLPQDMPSDALELLAANAAPPVEAVQDEPVWGWVSPRHLLDTNICDDTCKLAHYYHVCLRLAERKIPASLLNAECKMAELARLAEPGVERLGRKERKQIKEEVRKHLLSQMPPQFVGIYVCIDPQSHLLYTTAVSNSQMESMIVWFHKTFGFEPIPLVPETLALSQYEIDPANIPALNISPDLDDSHATGSLGDNFLTWLWHYQEENEGNLPPSKMGDFKLLLDGPLVLTVGKDDGTPCGALESNIKKGTPTISAEAKAALLVGKKLHRAKLVLFREPDQWEFTFDPNDFAFKGTKIPEGEAMDVYSVFEERMTNVITMHSVMFALFGKFLNEMSDETKAAAYQASAKKWIADRAGK